MREGFIQGGAEHYGPAAGVDDQGVVPAGLGMAAFDVPALPDRAGTAVGHEVVVDEVDRVGGRVGGQHPGGEGPLQPEWIGAVGEGTQAGPQRLEFRDGHEPDRRAGLSPAQVLAARDWKP